MVITMGSLRASDHGFHLATVDDALDVLASGLPGCVFEVSDLSAEFFTLANGLAGDCFQKFVNYHFAVGFVLGDAHGFGERINELMRDHRAHPYIRFFSTSADAIAWLESRQSGATSG